MNIRPMAKTDINSVVDIIGSHDEDDGEDALSDFKQYGIELLWVAEIDLNVVGVSGYREVPDSFGSGWISWTYVHQNHRRKGVGKKIFQRTIDEATGAGAQKLFIKVSNYIDDTGLSIYEAATKMYETFGFECEIVSKDFYDIGEDQFIYSKNLIPLESTNIEKENEKPVVRFVDIYEISETEGAYSFKWEVQNKTLVNRRSFSVNDLLIGLRAVENQGGRIVFLTFPSNLPLIHSPLVEAGFKFVGELKDYYEPGVHEMHFVHRLDGL